MERTVVAVVFDTTEAQALSHVFLTNGTRYEVFFPAWVGEPEAGKLRLGAELALYITNGRSGGPPGRVLDCHLLNIDYSIAAQGQFEDYVDAVMWARGVAADGTTVADLEAMEAAGVGPDDFVPDEPRPDERALLSPSHCPKCGEKILEVIYGLPGPGLMAKAQRGEVLLGGCGMPPEDPLWDVRCRECGWWLLGEAAGFGGG